MIRAAILATGRPITLATNGHRARGARVDLEHVDVAVLDGVLHIHQAADLERERERARLALEFGDDARAERMRRQRAGAVAGMDAGFFDVLHDADNDGVLAVGEAVDIDFDGVGKVAVDQQRALVRDHELRRPVEIVGQPCEVAVELDGIEHDLHGAPAQHVGGPDHDRIADRVGDRACLASGGGDAAGGWRRPSSLSSFWKRLRSSARSIVSGEVPRIGTRLLQRLGELQRRLSAELHDDAVQRVRSIAPSR